MKSHKVAILAILAIAGLAMAVPASAANLQILYTGINLCYDGSTLYNADEVGGYDQLDIAVFKVDGVTVGTSIPTYLQTSISGVENIPVGGGTVFSDSFAGIFDLHFGTFLGTDGYLALDWGEPVKVEFDGTDMTIHGNAVVGGIFGQSLPFGLTMAEPVTVSFSTQVFDKTDDGQVLTSFKASGTGEVTGPVDPIPEPATLLLLGAGLLGGRIVSRRRKK